MSRISPQDNPIPGGDLGPENPQEVSGDESSPMQNNVVLTRFLEICELSDLKIFRIVSKEWYKLSLHRFRNEMTVKLEPNVFTEINNVAQLYSERILEKPFKSYRLRWFVWGGNDPDPASGWWSSFAQPMSTFWVRCGPSIRRLELDDCIIQNMEAAKRNLCWMPNLEILIIKIPFFMYAESLRSCGTWQSPQKLRYIQIHFDVELPLLSSILSKLARSVGDEWTLSRDELETSKVAVSLEKNERVQQ